MVLSGVSSRTGKRVQIRCKVGQFKHSEVARKFTCSQRSTEKDVRLLGTMRSSQCTQSGTKRDLVCVECQNSYPQCASGCGEKRPSKKFKYHVHNMPLWICEGCRRKDKILKNKDRYPPCASGCGMRRPMQAMRCNFKTCLSGRVQSAKRGKTIHSAIVDAALKGPTEMIVTMSEICPCGPV
jgi:hypothetical protein